MIHPHDSPIVRHLSRVLIPFLQLFAVYVVVHGQYSPGGGFVGGVVFGTSLILGLLAFGTGQGQGQGLAHTVAFRWEGVGLLLLAGVGTLCLIGGAEFLNYHALLLPGMEASARRWTGILLAQIGVGIDVAATAVAIFFSLSLFNERDDDHA